MSPVETEEAFLNNEDYESSTQNSHTEIGVSQEESSMGAEENSRHSSTVDVDSVFYKGEITDAVFYNSDEEYEACVSEVQGKNWRSNWFVRNFLTDIPIVGYFFRDANCAHTSYLSVKSVFKLAASAAAMRLVLVEQAENIDNKIFKLVVVMALGKTVGGIGYNTIKSGMKALYNRYLKNSLISLLSKDDDAEAEFARERREIAVNNATKGWRNNWFSRTVFVEAPIIGHFFRHTERTEAIYFAGKSVCGW